MRVVRLSKEEWSELSEKAHLSCFAEHRPKSLDKIDFALVVEKDGAMICYGTYREIDSETIYMQYGGVFPESRKTVGAFKSYLMIINYLAERYKMGNTLIENTNVAMQKFAMGAGALPTGIRHFKGLILVEYSFNF